MKLLAATRSKRKFNNPVSFDEKRYMRGCGSWVPSGSSLAGSNSVTSASAATPEKFRNSPELLCNLAVSVWNLRLLQFDRISLRIMQAGEPAVGIRLRVNLDRDSRGL